MVHDHLTVPVELRQCARSGALLPIIGFGYPDFIKGPGADTLAIMAGATPAAVNRWIGRFGAHTWPLFHTLARLPVRTMIAFTPDSSLGKILEYYDSAWVTVAPAQQQLPPGRRYLLPLGGLIEDWSSLLVGPREFLTIERRPMWLHAAAMAARLPLLVVGCDPSDERLLHVLIKLRPVPIGGQAGWLVTGDINGHDAERWNAAGYTVIINPIAGVLRAITSHGVTGREEVSRAAVRPSRDGSETPYKYLDYYTEADQDFYFGREADTGSLVDLILSHRVTVVTGPSGIGKTSLLIAGAATVINTTEDHRSYYVRIGDDPLAAIVDECTRSLELSPQSSHSRDLRTCLAGVRERVNKIPVIVLDQMEEVFTRVGEALRTELFAAVSQIATRPALEARFVISLRDDYLAFLADSRDMFPSVLQNVYRLVPMSHQGIMDAIVKPAAAVGVKVSEALASRIIDDIGLTSLSGPHMQLVCTRLFMERKGTLISDTDYERLGGARAIMAASLSSELTRFGTSKGSAVSVLKAMVTSLGTKDVLRSSDVARRCHLPEELVSQVLIRLRDSSRLVRSVTIENEQLFELAHEYLTYEIGQWLTKDEIKQREVSDAFEREVRSWRRFRDIRVGVDRLQLFGAWNASLDIDSDGLCLLLLSAVRHGMEVALWVNRSSELGPTFESRIAEELFGYFRDRDSLQRRQAAETISVLDSRALIRALERGDERSQMAALEMLGGLACQEATEPISQLLRHQSAEIHALACGALGEIGDERAARLLLAVAGDSDLGIRGPALQALSFYDSSDVATLLVAALSTPGKLAVFAKAGLREGRSPKLFGRILRHELLSGAAREAVWSIIRDADERLREWVDQSLSELSVIDQERAIEALHLSTRSLELVAKGNSTASRLAAGQLASRNNREERETRFKEALDRAGEREVTAEWLRELLSVGDDTDFWAAAHYIAACGEKVSALLLELLREKSPRVKQGCLYAIYNMRAFRIPERLLVSLLGDMDATVRYLSCVVAARVEVVNTVDSISRLIDDFESVGWFLVSIGPRVSDAASYALDVLRPESRVWRKGFQTSFKKRLLDLETSL